MTRLAVFLTMLLIAVAALSKIAAMANGVTP